MLEERADKDLGMDCLSYKRGRFAHTVLLSYLEERGALHDQLSFLQFLHNYLRRGSTVSSLLYLKRKL
jgi:hypothetical protein